MKLKVIITTLLFSAAPIAATAACFGGHSDTTAMSCVEGTQWDPQTRTCVTVSTS